MPARQLRKLIQPFPAGVLLFTLLVPWLVLCGCSRSYNSGEKQTREPEARRPGESSVAPPQTKAQPSPALVPEEQARDFGAEARLIYRVAACGGEAPLPSGLDKTEVERHCAEFRPGIERYRKHYEEKIKPFFDAVIPDGLPAKIVYPFGGGDLLSALNTYREAAEITTLSLELAGDPRRLESLDSVRLHDSLEVFRRQVSGLLSQNNSTSEILQNAQRGDLPGQLAFFITALAVHRLEPVSLRYFTVRADGSLHYLSQSEIHELEDKSALQRKTTWIPPDFSEAFANSELTFRRPGEGGAASLVVHRHIAANLSNNSLRGKSAILEHLKMQGRIAAMTKAASYLLWNPGFTTIRQYLLDSMVFMVSDSTGIPPELARSSGFTQETFGSFQGSFLEASPVYNEEFRTLWNSQPRRKMPFRYGYLDSGKSYHLVITSKAAN